MNIKTEISKIHYNKQAKGLTFSLLRFCSIFYGIGSRFKNLLYDKNILKPVKVDAYVISVGNLTTGGVGKTPVVAQIADYFIKKGEKVAIISRGYGGKVKGIVSDGKQIFMNAKQAGDEPRWLAENTKAVVITSPVRSEGAKLAIENFGVQKIILDDGFQHRKMHRDLDIVLVDSEKMFGNENLLPAGPLREGFEAFTRIDKLVVVDKSQDHTRAEKYAKIMAKKLKVNTVVCRNEPDVLYNIFDEAETLQADKNKKIIAFSAIGQPEQFYKFLADFNVAKTTDFDDHHKYSQKDVDELNCLCEKYEAKYLVTTEKDAVKCRNFKSDVKIFALKLKTTLDVEKLLSNK